MSSRSKGASAEREVALLLHKELQDIIDKPERNLQQTRDGGHDLLGVPLVAIEVKRVEQLAIEKWWAQTIMQADFVGCFPVLVYRQSRKPWTFVMSWDILCPDMNTVPGHFSTDIIGFGRVYRRLVSREA